MADAGSVWAPARVHSRSKTHLVIRTHKDQAVRFSACFSRVPHSPRNFLGLLTALLSQEHTFELSKAAELPPLQNPDILVSVDDLTDLSYLHEPAGAYLISSLLLVLITS